MRKKEGWCFKKLVILGIALALVVSFVAMTAYTTGERKAEMTAQAPGAGIRDSGIGATKDVVWDNGMWYEDMLTAQDDPIEGLDSEPADDFMFDVDQLVNDVHWLGGYWNGPPNDGDFDWRVTFYNDDGTGTKPGAVLATWVFPNAQVNETLVEALPDGGYYSYAVDLPATLTFAAGTKYWISIQGVGIFPPQSGWAFHSDQILLHEAVFRSVYFGYPNWTDLSYIMGYPIDMCFQLTYEEECDWQPGDPHKMHFPQLPDEDGWDVNATQPLVLADDWRCSEEGWVKDIHFWGSWKHGIEGTIVGFWLSIHSNIPDPDGPGPGYSMPGVTLWELYVEDFGFTPIDPPTMEGWYDPSTGEVIPDDHDAYFQYNICLDSLEWFYQYQDTIYWLNISAIVLEYPEAVWGWKNSQDHFMDDAVWGFWGELFWIPIWEPQEPLVTENSFWIEFDGTGHPTPNTGGTDFYDDGTSWNGFFYYPNTGWWNMWFYDHPFDPDRYKDIFIFFDWYPTAPEYWIEAAINWATPYWPPGGPPPVPPLSPDEEDSAIIREFIPMTPPGIPVEYAFTIPWYNPEWVSIDIMGMNVIIPQGYYLHECLPPDDSVSLDLAFVITGGPECTPSIDAEKKVWDEDNQAWVDSIDMDVCNNAEFLITIHNDGTCCDLTDIMVEDFMDASLEYVDADPPPDYVDPIPDGTLIGWSFPGPLEPCNTISITLTAHVVGPACHLDSNYIFVHGACEPQAIEVYDEDVAYVHATEEPWPNHKMHFPQLPDPEGWDVIATEPIVLADDFMCTESGRITDIHLWGSWWMDIEGPIEAFVLSIHENIPGPPYSRPGELLWEAFIPDYEMTVEGPGMQGWYDPAMPFWEYPDHMMYYRYDITNIPEPFCQDSGTIYWLNVMAIGPMMYPDPPLWGWKTSLQHYEDDAVWAFYTPPVYEWIPLTDPITGMTLDLSFVITGEDALCGDVNHNGAVDAGDVVYLLSYLFRGGSPPCPLLLGDVNCSGAVDAGDVVYLISYLFRGGPPPCDPNNDGIPDC